MVFALRRRRRRRRQVVISLVNTHAHHPHVSARSREQDREPHRDARDGDPRAQPLAYPRRLPKEAAEPVLICCHLLCVCAWGGARCTGRGREHYWKAQESQRRSVALVLKRLAQHKRRANTRRPTAPPSLCLSPGRLHEAARVDQLVVGARADEEQHHGQERLEVEERRHLCL